MNTALLSALTRALGRAQRRRLPHDLTSRGQSDRLLVLQAPFSCPAIDTRIKLFVKRPAHHHSYLVILPPGLTY
ncbi:hypothetical protein J6590_008794 [Homalodisca vitripennis]|nr:hypothetical protein J6590_008794 [Homalodisca vitripennis]